jgi:hypothetical protein
MIPFINLRKIDKKRLRNLKDRVETNLKSEDIWFVHTVLAQCFLPYHDPKTERWHKKNGAFGFDHGVGHSLLLLYDAKVPKGQNSKKFNDLGYDPSNISKSLFYIITKYSIFITI